LAFLFEFLRAKKGSGWGPGPKNIELLRLFTSSGQQDQHQRGEKVMNRKTVYKIEIKNWEKYNKSVKKGHPCIMLSKRFFDDIKIQRLPAGGRLLYLGLLLRRGEVESTFIEASFEDLLRFAGGSGQVVSRLLSLLESFQLVTVEKIEPFNNRIELNRIEKKIKEERVESKDSTTKMVQNETPDAARSNLPEKSGKLAAEKSRSELVIFKNESDFINAIPEKTKQRWSALYQDPDFLQRELLKAFNWYENNPKKKPKTVRGWIQAMSSWFERGWVKHVRTIQSQQVTGLSDSQWQNVMNGREV
jgi:hypothetical protein